MKHWRDRLNDRKEVLIGGAEIALLLVVIIWAALTVCATARASTSHCPSCARWHTWGARWKAQAIRLRKVQHAASGWRTATASTYFEPQSIAGPGGYYRGVGDKRHIVAHKTLPFRTRVEFSYRGRRCVGVVLDRGPFVAGRTWDLSWAVAGHLGFRSGVGTVKWRVLR